MDREFEQHRALHTDQGRALIPMCHAKRLKAWRIQDPRFIAALEAAGVAQLRHLSWIRLDNNLITALVERWWPHTNSFHFPCGEMTVTLQDVAIILGIRIDGLPLIDHPVIGRTRRWPDWPSCCDELLGDHPTPGVIIQNPIMYEGDDEPVQAEFDMGQSKSKTNLPLRWLLWTFGAHLDFTDDDDVTILRHVRAYIMYIIGAMLMPDTSGSEVHCRWLPLLEDIDTFSTYSLGAATLGHLYRELYNAIDVERVRVAGCMHLLQVWSWEHLHVGRPILHIPDLSEDHQGPLGARYIFY